MMLDRDKLSFWVRLVAIVLAAVFLLSGVFMGLGMSGVSYNLFELIGSGSQQQQSPPSVSAEDQIQEARQEVEENPKEADNYQELAGLYYTNGQTEEAVKTLEQGHEAVPKDAETTLLLAELYEQQAQTSSGEEQEELYAGAGDAYADAARSGSGEEAESYYRAGEAYERAGQTDKAVKYWNEYLDRDPDGERAERVKQQISEVLQGGSTTP